MEYHRTPRNRHGLTTYIACTVLASVVVSSAILALGLVEWGIIGLRNSTSAIINTRYSVFPLQGYQDAPPPPPPFPSLVYFDVVIRMSNLL